MLYFTQDRNGKQGHPTINNKLITSKLKKGSIKIIRRTKDTMLVKFVNKIFNNSDTVDAEFRLGIDPGVNHIGFALYKIFKNNIRLLLSGEAEIRSTSVSDNLKERSMYRNTRRYFRRKNIKREFGKAKFRKPRWKNRFSNTYQPTHRHLINTHTRIIKWFFKQCPINKIHIEYAKFDMQKMQNPNIYSFWYQLGPQYAFENVKSYIRSRDNYTCQSCKKSCLDNNEVHHIIPRSKGGTDKPDNLILLCSKCHEKIHAELVKCPTVKSKNLKQSGLLNSCMKKLFEILENAISTQDTYGSITKAVRLNSNLDKSHTQDAQIIAFCDSLGLQEMSNYNYKDLNNYLTIKQYRRHDRSWVKRFEDRKYYDIYTNKLVANNRNRSSTQKKSSLTDLHKDNVNTQVYVKPGGPIYRRSNTQRKFKPGDLIRYGNQVDICKGWASTQRKVILENSGYVKQKDCKVIRNNSGLIYV